MQLGKIKKLIEKNLENIGVTATATLTENTETEELLIQIDSATSTFASTIKWDTASQNKFDTMAFESIYGIRKHFIDEACEKQIEDVDEQ